MDPEKIFHIADQMLLLPQALGCEPDSGGWAPLRNSNFDAAAEKVLHGAGIGPADGPLVLLHPGGKWPPKRWPTENFSKVIDILQEKGIRAAVMGGPGDESAIEAIRQKCRSEPIFLWPAGPLETIWGILKLADAFIGNDSGPMHMAAAAGTPIVALFGPTHPGRCGARGSEIIQFYANLECSPCPLYFSKNLCHRGHNYCMDNFGPEDVADAVSNLIKNTGLPRRIRQASPTPEPR